ncbi:sulfite exporter TauE/SafE family protein [Allopusillimonas ginsengisoli]|uniref:sulfite exporter TauE/SafE family protein n=1 Tax=Allopusillimonas ginsengisoli TaxID=453575 RepID=UPI001020B6D0|nr:sulfite exporter TauE/SafE family protein [Allopusillimonas ginsengisoli]TEA79604.1 sulfite exporter TauE/SafE family protein [Allopusillimonas ginsengisoli]
MSFIPTEITSFFAITLIALSFVTSAFTASMGLGGGVAMLAVLGLGLPVTSVLPVHGVVQMGSNAGRVMIQRSYIVAPLLVWFTLGSLAGIAIGGSLVVNIPEKWAKASLALFILWSVYRKKPKTDIQQHGKIYFVVGGAVSSFFTMLVGSTGPLVAALLASTGLIRQPLVATHAVCMVIQHGLKILVFGMLGFAYAEWAPLLAAMIASGLAGTWVGTRTLDNLPEKTFRLGFKIVMTIVSLHMLWQIL